MNFYNYSQQYYQPQQTVMRVVTSRAEAEVAQIPLDGSNAFFFNTSNGEVYLKAFRADGTKGAHWTKDQAKSLMAQGGADADLLEYWSVLNALYSDYSEVLKKFGIDRTEVYTHLAKAWLDDEDAVQDKAKRYFEYIVEH